MGDALHLRLPPEVHEKIAALANAPTDNFLELVKYAQMDPRADFVGMSFAEMSIDGLQLKGFNFTDADFLECSLKGTVFVDCELKGAAFRFPPTTRNTWPTRKDYIVGNEGERNLELIRIASEAARKEERKEALKQLLKVEEADLSEFLKDVCLRDKAKSIRIWLRKELTRNYEDKSALRSIIEKSFFSTSHYIDDELALYTEFFGRSKESIDTICQACMTNSSLILKVAPEFASTSSFKETMLRNLAYSGSHAVWVQSALTLSSLDIDPGLKSEAFKARLHLVRDSYELSALAAAAAQNGVRLPSLFEMCAAGYSGEGEGWLAGSLLMYCYYFLPKKYEADVLFHSFKKERGLGDIFNSSAFEAYCLVQSPPLYKKIREEVGSFYIDPRSFVGLQKPDYDYYSSSRWSDGLKRKAGDLVRQAYKEYQEILEDQVIRR